MKAVQISQYGGPEVLKLNDNIAEPTLKENQVLIEIHAASINPFDSFILAGYVKDMIKSVKELQTLRQMMKFTGRQ